MSGQGENDDVVNEAEAILNRDLKVSSHTQKRCKRSSTLSLQNLDVAQGTERGLADFRSSLLSLLAATQAQLKYRRNDLQDRIIAASNQRCGTYLRVLMSSKSQNQMGMGSLTTLLSGAATVTTPISAARLLTAGSTVTSGVMGVYNEAYFNNLTVNVISAGIAKHREGLLQYMDAGRGKDMKAYPVNRAIADALSYHEACNIVTGLQAASSATNAANAKTVAGK